MRELERRRVRRSTEKVIEQGREGRGDASFSPAIPNLLLSPAAAGALQQQNFTDESGTTRGIATHAGMSILLCDMHPQNVCSHMCRYISQNLIHTTIPIHNDSTDMAVPPSTTAAWLV